MMRRVLLLTGICVLLFANSGFAMSEHAKSMLEELRTRQTATDRQADSLFTAVQTGETSMWQRAIEENPALLASRDASGASILHVLAFNGAIEGMNWVLTRGLAVDLTDRAGWTALHYAAAADQLAAARLLVEHHARADIRDKHEITPLHAAAGNGSTAMIELLLNAGADSTRRDLEGKVPADWARDAGHTSAAPLLDGTNSNAVSEQTARAIDADDEAIDDPLALAVAIEEFESDDLFAAIRAGDLDLVKSILTQDTGLLGKRDQTGATPLHAAAFLGQAAMVEHLLRVGAGINLADDYGWTALHYASAGNHARVAEQLLRHGANINARDAYGITALHAAAGNKSVQTAQILIARGADTQAPDTVGSTPTEWAAKASPESSEFKQILASHKTRDLKRVSQEPVLGSSWKASAKTAETAPAVAQDLPDHVDLSVPAKPSANGRHRRQRRGIQRALFGLLVIAASRAN